jgi:hypothetical protein
MQEDFQCGNGKSIDEMVEDYRNQLLTTRGHELCDPFFIRHRTVSKTVDVEIIQAAGPQAARIAPRPKQRRGYYTDERVEPDVQIFGPFTSREQAEADEKAWTEDV